MKNEDWIKSRISYIRRLKSPSESQRLLVLLAEKPDRTSADERALSALVRAERAAERLMLARSAAARIVDADKKAQRKARNHAMFQAAGLLALAGLLDGSTGELKMDRGALLGGLQALRESAGDPRTAEGWKAAGDALIASSESERKHN